MPVKLNDVYVDALKRVKYQPAAIANLSLRVLAWVLCAVRPLHIEELQHALAVETGDRKIDLEGLTDAAVIISCCCGLVFLNPRDKTVQFVHLTVQQYLNSFRSTWIPNADNDVAADCLTYLNFEAFWRNPCEEDEELETRLEDYPFLSYAATNWGYHVQSGTQEKLQGLVKELLASNARLAVPVQVVDIMQLRYRSRAQRYRHGVTDVQIAATFGLRDLVELLVDGGADIEARNSADETALYLGVAGGHEAVVKLLIEKGANVNAKAGTTVAYYKWATFSGCEKLVRMIISNGATIDEQGGRSGNALQATASRGPKGVVQLLLDKGVDANAQGGPHGNALRAAA